MRHLARRTLLFSLACAPLWAPAWAQPRAGAFALELSPREIIDARAEAYSSTVDPDDRITWDVYAPAPRDRPPGLFVYISPVPTGAAPEDWRRVLEDSNLVWIGARQAGNEILTNKRFMFAVLAVEAIKTEIAIDVDRVYVGGFSGGGRVASMVASELPGVFKGAMYFAGVNWVPPRDADWLQLMRSNWFVFVTGRHDFNRGDTRRAYREYRDADIEQILLLDLGYLGHRLPRVDDFENGVRFLDGLGSRSAAGGEDNLR